MLGLSQAWGFILWHVTLEAHHEKGLRASLARSVSFCLLTVSQSGVIGFLKVLGLAHLSGVSSFSRDL